MNSQKESSRLEKTIARIIFACVVLSFLMGIVMGIISGFSTESWHLWTGIAFIFLAPLMFWNALDNRPRLFPPRKPLFERLGFISWALILILIGVSDILKAYNINDKPYRLPTLITLFVASMVLFYLGFRTHRKHFREKEKKN